MSWTYDPSQLGDATVGPLMQVRFLVHDTNVAKPLLLDEEINWLLTQEMNVYMVAARCCDVLILSNGMIAAKKISEFAITYDVKFYRTLRMELQARGLNYQTPYMGGISIADKLAQQANVDAVRPKIQIGQGDNPSAPVPDNPLTSI